MQVLLQHRGGVDVQVGVPFIEDQDRRIRHHGRSQCDEHLLSARTDTALDRLLPPPPRPFRVAVVANAAADSSLAEVQVTPPHTMEGVRRPLGLAYPPEVYSLSHVALPFPLSDGLYGLDPDPADSFGIRLGDIAARGEYGALIVNVDMLVRTSSNPFFSYVLERIEAGLPKPTAPVAPSPAPAAR